MVNISTKSDVFLHGHSPTDGSDVFVNVSMIVGAEIGYVTVKGEKVKATVITAAFGGDYRVKESFQELIDKANGYMDMED